MITIPNDVHLDKDIRSDFVVSIRWRSQDGVYANTAWTDLGYSRFQFARLYDDWHTISGNAASYATEPLLRKASQVPCNFDMEQEWLFTCEVDKNHPLAQDPQKTFGDNFSDAYPPEHADIFVSVVLGETINGTQTTQLLWAGAIEDVQETEEMFVITAVDPTRKLLLPLTESVNETTYPDAETSANGSYCPLPVGRVKQFSPYAIVDQKWTALEEELPENSGVIHLKSVENFPDSGVVVINDELIGYTSVSGTYGENTLTGLTRGYDGTTAQTHAANSLAFIGTEQTINGTDIYGPVYKLSGVAGPTGVTSVQAHDSGGKASFELDATDYVVEENSSGVLLGLRRRRPQSPAQRDDSIWYAVEMDRNSSNNRSLQWEFAAGANPGFDEVHAARVSGEISGTAGTPLALIREAKVENVGASRIKRVYALVEYGNIGNPIADARSVPSAGINCAAFLRYTDEFGNELRTELVPESGGQTFTAENLPVEADDNSAHRTLTTHAISDPHYHDVDGIMEGEEEAVDTLADTMMASGNSWNQGGGFVHWDGTLWHNYEHTAEELTNMLKGGGGGGDGSGDGVFHWSANQSQNHDLDLIDNPEAYLQYAFWKPIDVAWNESLMVTTGQSQSGGSGTAQFIMRRRNGGTIADYLHTHTNTGSSDIGEFQTAGSVVGDGDVGSTANFDYLSQMIPVEYVFKLTGDVVTNSVGVLGCDWATGLGPCSLLLRKQSSANTLVMAYSHDNSTSGDAYAKCFREPAWTRQRVSWQTNTKIHFTVPNPNSSALPTRCVVLGNSSVRVFDQYGNALSDPQTSYGEPVSFYSGVTFADLENCYLSRHSNGFVDWTRLSGFNTTLFSQ